MLSTPHNHQRIEVTKNIAKLTHIRTYSRFSLPKKVSSIKAIIYWNGAHTAYDSNEHKNDLEFWCGWLSGKNKTSFYVFGNFPNHIKSVPTN